ncbi:hypothetical protein PLESTB_001784200 [Pleodorina starrii]|uniref:Fe2OG dioxygenase domain-containing protein n=1 Tax=Pleodorina starrii TaxID=330485 RepID=A0A9W6C190_9CHLO|nr:hypothetical protein PLESTM_001755100 [Pleodorina starrii]GLC61625.1 hypothetical protein PLESTB_001784200 [Pleodorina starrii]GLC76551.1 hypothetical protein PLESTF_001795300 [Pleodorina starrii]
MAAKLAVTAKTSRLDALLHDLFDDCSEADEELVHNDSDTSRQLICSIGETHAANSSPRTGTACVRPGVDCPMNGSEHPLLEALKTSMTSLHQHQLVQIASPCKPVPRDGTAAGRAFHPLPGLAILRGALSAAQQLDVASAILQSGCLAGEGSSDGGGAGTSGDPGSLDGCGHGAAAVAAATATRGGCDGSGRRPKGLPNQAMFFGDLPAWAQQLTELLPLGELLPPDLAARRPSFDQAIVNLYRPGEGICSHVDLARFQDGIVSVSIGGPIVMHFTRCDPRVGGSGSGCDGGASGCSSAGDRAGGCDAECGQGRCGAQPGERERASAAGERGGAEDVKERDPVDPVDPGADVRVSEQQQQQRAAEKEAEPPACPAPKRQRCDLAGNGGPPGASSTCTGTHQGQLPQEQQYWYQEEQQQQRRAASGPVSGPPGESASDTGAGAGGRVYATAGAGDPSPCTGATCGGSGRAAAAAEGTPEAVGLQKGGGRGGGCSGRCRLDKGVFWRGPDHLCLLLQGGDLLAMAGEARYGWEHGIRPVVSELLGETGCDKCTAAAASGGPCRGPAAVAAARFCGFGSDAGRAAVREAGRSVDGPGEVAFDAAGGGNDGVGEGGKGDVGGGGGAAAVVVAAAAGGGRRGSSPAPVPISIARGVRLSITLRRLCPDIVLCEM